MEDDQLKQALKEGLKEWMDEKWASFGKWTGGALGAFLLGLIVYGIMTLNGWHK